MIAFDGPFSEEKSNYAATPDPALGVVNPMACAPSTARRR